MAKNVHQDPGALLSVGKTDSSPLLAAANEQREKQALYM